MVPPGERRDPSGIAFPVLFTHLIRKQSDNDTTAFGKPQFLQKGKTQRILFRYGTRIGEIAAPKQGKNINTVQFNPPGRTEWTCPLTAGII